MATVTDLQQLNATGVISLLTTELNSLASVTNSALSSAFSNVVGGTAGLVGYQFGTLMLAYQFGTAPGANTGASIYLARSIDGGTTYETAAEAFASRGPAGVIGYVNDTSAHNGACRIKLPPGYWKAFLYNGGANSMAATGNTLKLLADTPTGQ